MSLKSQNIEISELQPSSKTAPNQPIRKIEAPAIGDEMKKLAQVELKEDKLPANPKEIAAIKLMVAMAYPNVDIENITDLDLQTKYYPQYLNGTLQKKCEALRPKIKEALDIIKKEHQNPGEAADNLLDKYLAMRNKRFESLPKHQKEKLRYETKVKFLKLVMPEKFTTGTKQEERRNVRELTTTSESFIYALQTGKISSKEDFESFFKDPHRISELQYDWADAYFKEHPDVLERLNNKSENRDLKENTSERRMYTALQRGNLDKAILKANNMKDFEELYHSGKYTELKFAYLKEHETELNNYERRELETLTEQANNYRGDLSGVRNVAAGTNVDTSLTEQIIEADGIDIQNGEIEIKNKEDLEKLAGYTQQIKKRLNECNTEEEIKACIQDIRSHAQTDHEAKILDMMMNHIIAEFSENENNILTPELYVNALKEIDVSAHMAVETSVMGNTKTQKAYSNVVAKSEDMTNTQKAGYTVNITPQYETEAQSYSVNTMTDTGIKEVHDVLPETFAKLDQNAAKESFEYAMNSNAVSDETKAIIARDTIDSTSNSDLKKFYEDLANKYKIDYTSVPPKSERVPQKQTEKTSNEPSDNKVQGTNFTEKEIAEIIARQQDPNVLELIGNGIRETVDIILGKTPDVANKTTPAAITSLNTAITQLQAGTKLSDVFRNSNPETKKDLVEIICTYGKTAIAQLIDAFGGQTIYNLAKTDAAKRLIRTELERIALSDSTQRAELEAIKKAEEKEGMRAKA